MENVYFRRFKATPKLHNKVRARVAQVNEWTSTCLKVAEELGFTAFHHRDFAKVTSLSKPLETTDLSQWTRTKYAGWRPKRNSKKGHALYKEVFDKFPKGTPLWDFLLEDGIRLPTHDFCFFYNCRTYSATATLHDDYTLISVPWLHHGRDKVMTKFFEWEPSDQLIEITEKEFMEIKE